MGEWVASSTRTPWLGEQGWLVKLVLLANDCPRMGEFTWGWGMEHPRLGGLAQVAANRNSNSSCCCVEGLVLFILLGVQPYPSG